MSQPCTVCNEPTGRCADPDACEDIAVREYNNHGGDGDEQTEVPGDRMPHRKPGVLGGSTPPTSSTSGTSPHPAPNPTDTGTTEGRFGTLRGGDSLKEDA